MTDITRAIPVLDQPMVWEFPRPGPALTNAYREIAMAIHGTDEQKNALGEPNSLPRPWEPATCRTPVLREQLWDWLDQVVTWLNHEYVWDPAPAIPPCWPSHPHLVHEIAVLADQRRRAGRALTSDALEEWHRYSLTMFRDRMGAGLRDHCTDGHQAWPARSRHAAHVDDARAGSRSERFKRDLQTSRAELDRAGGTTPRLRAISVDLDKRAMMTAVHVRP